MSFCQLEKPKFDKSGIYGPIKEIKVKAGEPIDILLDIVGAPTPEVTWTKDDEKKPLENNANGYPSSSLQNKYYSFFLKL